MSTDSAFTPRSLTASEYVRELLEPADNAAVRVRNRSTGHTVQRIAKAEVIASPAFQTWLAGQNAGGSDVFMGMNPLKDGAHSRTKDQIKDIRHVYLDLDRKGDEALEAIRNSPSVPAPNFVLDTSPGKHQVVWKVSGFSQDEAESLLHSLANQFGGDLAATDSTLDFGEPVAVMLLSTSTLAFIADTDAAAAAVSALAAAVPSGSYVSLYHQASDLDAALPVGIRRWNRLSAQPITLRSRAEVADLVAGLDLVPPGLVPITEWRPEQDDPRYDQIIPVHGVLARKP